MKTTLMAESDEELKSLLMKVKEESKKVGLKLNIQKAKIMTSGPITSWDIDGETVQTVSDLIWVGGRLQNHCRWWLQPWNKKMPTLWKKSYDQPRWHIKQQRHYFVNKVPSSHGCGFSSGHVWMWELDYQESWVLKNWCFWTVVVEKTLESPLESKEIQSVHPKGDQYWVFIGRTDAITETPTLWPPNVRSWLIWKDPDPGTDWRQQEKGMTGWDGWMTSPTQTWVWVNSGSWWWTGRPFVLQSQRIGQNWMTELNWTDWYVQSCYHLLYRFGFVFAGFSFSCVSYLKKLLLHVL